MTIQYRAVSLEQTVVTQLVPAQTEAQVGSAYEALVSGPTDTFTHIFSDLEVFTGYTAFASDPTEVHGFDTEAQP